MRLCYTINHHLHPSGALLHRACASGAAAGKVVYDVKCKNCHGAYGQGNPAIAKVIKVEMNPLGETTADVKKVVIEGQGKMRPMAAVTGADRRPA